MIIRDLVAYNYQHGLSGLTDVTRIQFLALVGITIFLHGSIPIFLVSCFFCSSVLSIFVGVVSGLVPVCSLSNGYNTLIFRNYHDTWDR